MKACVRTLFYSAATTLLLAALASPQSRHNTPIIDTEGTILNVAARREDKKTDPIRIENLALFENGIEQKIKNFVFDPSPSKIVILVDNSQTLQTSVEAMKKAAMEFAYEIFEGDQLFIVAYDEKPEIIQEWTDNPKKMEASLATFRKKGNPRLFDAIDSTLGNVLLPLMPGTRKTALIVISDGLDRGSKKPYDKVLNELLLDNVTVYSLQLPDRTGGAYRRDQPKAAATITQLAEETGGKVFPFTEAQAAAKFICDELRQHRYLLSYVSANSAAYDARKLFIVSDDGISVRTKMAHPPNIK